VPGCATFAPVRDRYKIFIIDEAHMVTREGFNALLKIVEEPPEHIKFIFATTEPSKVLTTIRSRTHHYLFRLLGYTRGALFDDVVTSRPYPPRGPRSRRVATRSSCCAPPGRRSSPFSAARRSPSTARCCASCAMPRATS
jgi:hypothetical protein